MRTHAQTKAERYLTDTGCLEAESYRLQDNLTKCFRRHSRVQNEISRLDSVVARLRNRAAGTDANLDSEIRAEEEKLAALRNEAMQVEQDLRKVNDALSENKMKLEALGSGLTREDVLAFLDTVREAAERLPRLRASIDQQQAIQLEASKFENGLPRLEEQRENLLAAQAIGEATEDELVAINTAIEEEEVRLAPVLAEAKSKIADADKTSIGLRRLLEEATAKHKALLEKQPQIIAACLRSEGEVIGKQYLEAAEVLIGKFKRLVALERLCRELTPGTQDESVLFARDWRGMHLPALRSECGTATTGENAPSILFATSPAAVAEKFSSEAAREIARELADAGIPL